MRCSKNEVSLFCESENEKNVLPKKNDGSPTLKIQIGKKSMKSLMRLGKRPKNATTVAVIRNTKIQDPFLSTNDWQRENKDDRVAILGILLTG